MVQVNRKRSKVLKLDKEIGKRLGDKKLYELANRMLEKSYKKKKFGIKEFFLLLVKGVVYMYELTPRRLKYHLSPYMKDPELIVGWEPWQKFNPFYLKSQLSRLEKSKLVKTKRKGDKLEIRITRVGKIKVLRYAFDSLKLKKPEKWDGYFRLVVYDLLERLRTIREYLSKTFKRLNFYQLQKSIYLHVYPCEELIEFLSEFLGIGKYIRVFKIKFFDKKEEKIFKKYFDVN